MASYLGMNTSDIRDMQTKQWVFWVVAIPLTVVVLILARLWAGPAWPQLFSSFRGNDSPTTPRATITVPATKTRYFIERVANEREHISPAFS